MNIALCACGLLVANGLVFGDPMIPRYQLHRRGILLWEGVVVHGTLEVTVKVHLARVQHVKAFDVWWFDPACREFMLVSPHDPLSKTASQAAYEALETASTQIQPVVIPHTPQPPKFDQFER